MDDPHRLDQLGTVSGLHDQRLETFANAVEDLTAHLARAVARITALEGQVAQLHDILRHDRKRRT